MKTNEGRVDMTAETDAHCYAIELKLGKTAVSAIRQIKAKHYADRFAGNGKTLTLVGIAFSKAKRTIVAGKGEILLQGRARVIRSRLATIHCRSNNKANVLPFGVLL